MVSADHRPEGLCSQLTDRPDSKLSQTCPDARYGSITNNKITFFMQRDEKKKKANFDAPDNKVNLIRN